MIDFFGFRKLLSKENLWTTENEHAKVIKRVSQATSLYNLPPNLINCVLLHGINSHKFRRQTVKILKNNPRPPLLPPTFLQKLSEQELRIYIEQLSIVFQNQFDECVEILYDIERSDDDFAKIKESLERKLSNASIINLLLLPLFLILCVVLIFCLLFATNIKYVYIFFTSTVIIALILLVSYLILNKNFKIKDDENLNNYDN